MKSSSYTLPGLIVLLTIAFIYGHCEPLEEEPKDFRPNILLSDINNAVKSEQNEDHATKLVGITSRNLLQADEPSAPNLIQELLERRTRVERIKKWRKKAKSGNLNDTEESEEIIQPIKHRVKKKQPDKPNLESAEQNSSTNRDSITEVDMTTTISAVPRAMPSPDSDNENNLLFTEMNAATDRVMENDEFEIELVDDKKQSQENGNILIAEDLQPEITLMGEEESTKTSELNNNEENKLIKPKARKKRKKNKAAKTHNPTTCGPKMVKIKKYRKKNKPMAKKKVRKRKTAPSITNIPSQESLIMPLDEQIQGNTDMTKGELFDSANLQSATEDTNPSIIQKPTKDQAPNELKLNPVNVQEGQGQMLQKTADSAPAISSQIPVVPKLNNSGKQLGVPNNIKSAHNTLNKPRSITSSNTLKRSPQKVPQENALDMTSPPDKQNNPIGILERLQAPTSISNPNLMEQNEQNSTFDNQPTPEMRNANKRKTKSKPIITKNADGLSKPEISSYKLEINDSLNYPKVIEDQTENRIIQAGNEVPQDLENKLEINKNLVHESQPKKQRIRKKLLPDLGNITVPPRLKTLAHQSSTDDLETDKCGESYQTNKEPSTIMEILTPEKISNTDRPPKKSKLKIHSNKQKSSLEKMLPESENIPTALKSKDKKMDKPNKQPKLQKNKPEGFAAGNDTPTSDFEKETKISPQKRKRRLKETPFNSKNIASNHQPEHNGPKSDSSPQVGQENKEVLIVQEDINLEKPQHIDDECSAYPSKKRKKLSQGALPKLENTTLQENNLGISAPTQEDDIQSPNSKNNFNNKPSTINMQSKKRKNRNIVNAPEQEETKPQIIIKPSLNKNFTGSPTNKPKAISTTLENINPMPNLDTEANSPIGGTDQTDTKHILLPNTIPTIKGNIKSKKQKKPVENGTSALSIETNKPISESLIQPHGDKHHRSKPEPTTPQKVTDFSNTVHMPPAIEDSTSRPNINPRKRKKALENGVSKPSTGTNKPTMESSTQPHEDVANQIIPKDTPLPEDKDLPNMEPTPPVEKDSTDRPNKSKKHKKALENVIPAPSTEINRQTIEKSIEPHPNEPQQSKPEGTNALEDTDLPNMEQYPTANEVSTIRPKKNLKKPKSSKRGLPATLTEIREPTIESSTQPNLEEPYEGKPEDTTLLEDTDLPNMEHRTPVNEFLTKPNTKSKKRKKALENDVFAPPIETNIQTINRSTESHQDESPKSKPGVTTIIEDTTLPNMEHTLPNDHVSTNRPEIKPKKVKRKLEKALPVPLPETNEPIVKISAQAAPDEPDKSNPNPTTILEDADLPNTEQTLPANEVSISRPNIKLRTRKKALEGIPAPSIETNRQKIERPIELDQDETPESNPRVTTIVEDTTPPNVDYTLPENHFSTSRADTNPKKPKRALKKAFPVPLPETNEPIVDSTQVALDEPNKRNPDTTTILQDVDLPNTDQTLPANNVSTCRPNTKLRTRKKALEGIPAPSIENNGQTIERPIELQQDETLKSKPGVTTIIEDTTLPNMKHTLPNDHVSTNRPEIKPKKVKRKLEKALPVPLPETNEPIVKISAQAAPDEPDKSNPNPTILPEDINLPNTDQTLPANEVSTSTPNTKSRTRKKSLESDVPAPSIETKGQTIEIPTKPQEDEAPKSNPEPTTLVGVNDAPNMEHARPANELLTSRPHVNLKKSQRISEGLPAPSIETNKPIAESSTHPHEDEPHRSIPESTLLEDTNLPDVEPIPQVSSVSTDRPKTNPKKPEETKEKDRLMPSIETNEPTKKISTSLPLDEPNNSNPDANTFLEDTDQPNMELILPAFEVDTIRPQVNSKKHKKTLEKALPEHSIITKKPIVESSSTQLPLSKPHQSNPKASTLPKDTDLQNVEPISPTNVPSSRADITPKKAKVIVAELPAPASSVETNKPAIESFVQTHQEDPHLGNPETTSLLEDTDLPIMENTTPVNDEVLKRPNIHPKKPSRTSKKVLPASLIQMNEPIIESSSQPHLGEPYEGNPEATTPLELNVEDIPCANNDPTDRPKKNPKKPRKTLEKDLPMPVIETNKPTTQSSTQLPLAESRESKPEVTIPVGDTDLPKIEHTFPATKVSSGSPHINPKDTHLPNMKPTPPVGEVSTSNPNINRKKPKKTLEESLPVPLIRTNEPTVESFTQPHQDELHQSNSEVSLPVPLIKTNEPTVESFIQPHQDELRQSNSEVSHPVPLIKINEPTVESSTQPNQDELHQSNPEVITPLRNTNLPNMEYTHPTNNVSARRPNVNPKKPKRMLEKGLPLSVIDRNESIVESSTQPSLNEPHESNPGATTILEDTDLPNMGQTLSSNEVLTIRPDTSLEKPTKIFEDGLPTPSIETNKPIVKSSMHPHEDEPHQSNPETTTLLGDTDPSNMEHISPAEVSTTMPNIIPNKPEIMLKDGLPAPSIETNRLTIESSTQPHQNESHQSELEATTLLKDTDLPNLEHTLPYNEVSTGTPNVTPKKLDTTMENILPAPLVKPLLKSTTKPHEVQPDVLMAHLEDGNLVSDSKTIPLVPKLLDINIHSHEEMQPHEEVFPTTQPIKNLPDMDRTGLEPIDYQVIEQDLSHAETPDIFGNLDQPVDWRNTLQPDELTKDTNSIKLQLPEKVVPMFENIKLGEIEPPTISTINIPNINKVSEVSGEKSTDGEFSAEEDINSIAQFERLPSASNPSINDKHPTGYPQTLENDILESISNVDVSHSTSVNIPHEDSNLPIVDPIPTCLNEDGHSKDMSKILNNPLLNQEEIVNRPNIETGAQIKTSNGSDQMSPASMSEINVNDEDGILECDEKRPLANSHTSPLVEKLIGDIQPVNDLAQNDSTADSTTEPTPLEGGVTSKEMNKINTEPENSTKNIPSIHKDNALEGESTQLPTDFKSDEESEEFFNFKKLSNKLKPWKDSILSDKDEYKDNLNETKDVGDGEKLSQSPENISSPDKFDEVGPGSDEDASSPFFYTKNKLIDKLKIAKDKLGFEEFDKTDSKSVEEETFSEIGPRSIANTMEPLEYDSVLFDQFSNNLDGVNDNDVTVKKDINSIPVKEKDDIINVQDKEKNSDEDDFDFFGLIYSL